MSTYDYVSSRSMQLERCPHCEGVVCVRLPKNWQEQMNSEDRVSIPNVACGSPWHYGLDIADFRSVARKDAD